MSPWRAVRPGTVALRAASVLYTPLYAHPLSSQEFPRWVEGRLEEGRPEAQSWGSEFWHQPKVLGPSQQTLESLSFGPEPAVQGISSRLREPLASVMWAAG